MEASDSGGAKVMSIQGRMHSQRERTLGMTDAERAWRARYVKSLILDKSEPVVPENYYKETHNPIRRFYRAPMDLVERSLAPVVGKDAASLFRMTSAKIVMGILLAYYGAYYFKYNSADWMHRTGWRVFHTRAAVYPGSSNFPNFTPRTQGKDFYVFGFDKSPI